MRDWGSCSIPSLERVAELEPQVSAELATPTVARSLARAVDALNDEAQFALGLSDRCSCEEGPVGLESLRGACDSHDSDPKDASDVLLAPPFPLHAQGQQLWLGGQRRTKKPRASGERGAFPEAPT